VKSLDAAKVAANVEKTGKTLDVFFPPSQRWLSWDARHFSAFVAVE
jgi:hypothetical protein